MELLIQCKALVLEGDDRPEVGIKMRAQLLSTHKAVTILYVCLNLNDNFVVLSYF